MTDAHETTSRRVPAFEHATDVVGLVALGVVLWHLTPLVLGWPLWIAIPAGSGVGVAVYGAVFAASRVVLRRIVEQVEADVLDTDGEE